LTAVAGLALALPASSLGSFSGANGKIFYEGPSVGGSETDVFSINPDGSGEVDLSSGNGFSEQRPAASADAQHVVFQTYRDEGWNIFSMNADGSAQTNLTKTKEPVINFEPAWSPDGTKVAFMRQELGEQDIWIMNADGSGQVNLTESLAQYSTSAEFSPDGTRIVFVAAGPTPCCSTAYNNDIWVMNVNGSNPKQLTTTDFPTQNIGPAWSPDSAKIAYSTNSSPTGATRRGCCPVASRS
jgi:Tol biopolymer transport system component